MTALTVAVVLPVHNGMPYLAESIQSILDQSFAQFEFIIGDDGSSDGSSALLQRVAEADPRIRLIRRESKSGVAESLNWVMGATNADLIAIAHADDLSFPDRLRIQVEALERRPDAAAVASLSNHIDRRGRIIQPIGYWRLFRRSPFAPFAHSSLMVRRSVFNEVGGYRQQAEYWEDLDLYWRLLDVGPILVIPKVLTSYRHSDVSIRSRDEAQWVESALSLMYACAELHAAGIDHSNLLISGPGPRARIDPRIFIARSWTSVWQRHRPGTLRRLLERGDIHLDGRSFGSLAFVLAGTISPRLVALAVQSWMRIRDIRALSRIKRHNCAAYEWESRASRHSRSRIAADPSDSLASDAPLAQADGRLSTR